MGSPRPPCLVPLLCAIFVMVFTCGLTRAAEMRSPEARRALEMLEAELQRGGHSASDLQQLQSNIEQARQWLVSVQRQGMDVGEELRALDRLQRMARGSGAPGSAAPAAQAAESQSRPAEMAAQQQRAAEAARQQARQDETRRQAEIAAQQQQRAAEAARKQAERAQWTAAKQDLSGFVTGFRASPQPPPPSAAPPSDTDRFFSAFFGEATARSARVLADELVAQARERREPDVGAAARSGVVTVARDTVAETGRTLYDAALDLLPANRRTDVRTMELVASWMTMNVETIRDTYRDFIQKEIVEPIQAFGSEPGPRN